MTFATKSAHICPGRMVPRVGNRRKLTWLELKVGGPDRRLDGEAVSPGSRRCVLAVMVRSSDGPRSYQKTQFIPAPTIMPAASSAAPMAISMATADHGGMGFRAALGVLAMAHVTTSPLARPRYASRRGWRGVGAHSPVAHGPAGMRSITSLNRSKSCSRIRSARTRSLINYCGLAGSAPRRPRVELILTRGS